MKNCCSKRTSTARTFFAAPDELGGGEYSLGDAGPKRLGAPQGDGADQQALLCGVDRKRFYRCGDIAAKTVTIGLAGSHMCGAANVVRRAFAAGAARLKRSRWWCTATPIARKSSGAASKTFSLPEGTTLGAVVRGEGRHHCASRHHGAAGRSFDFVLDGSPPYIEAVEKLFQGSASFL